MRKKIGQFIQVALLIGFFSFNTLTVAKSLILLGSTFMLSGKNLKKYIDINLFLLLVFFIFYYIVSIYEKSNETGFDFQLFIMAPVIYMAGKWLGYNANSSLFLVRVFWIIGLSLSFLTLIPLYTDILNGGFVGASRNLSVSDNADVTSATVLAGMLIVSAGLSGLIFLPRIILGKIEFLVVMLLFFATLIAAARLGSRTIVVVEFVSLGLGAYTNRRYLNKQKLFLFILFISVPAYFAFEYISTLLEIMNFYNDRLGDDETGFVTAGGRTEKWINSLVLIFENPMGWSFNVNGYSHNLWLDTARIGGWLSFLLLITLTFYAAKSFIRSLARNSGDPLFYTTITCLGVSYLLLFMVEPIFDGFTYVFASFCCFWGIVQAFRPTNNPN